MRLKGLLLGKLLGAGFFNMVAWIALAVNPPNAWEPGIVHVVACVMGAIFGGGLGLAVGAGLGGAESVPPTLLARDSQGNVVGQLSGSPEKGLSVLDVLTSSLYALTLTGVGGVALLLAFDGPRGLATFVMEISPLGSVGPAWAMMSALGSIALVTLVPVLAFASMRPPLRRIEGSSRKLIAGAGFLSGLLWPGLLLVTLPLL